MTKSTWRIVDYGHLSAERKMLQNRAFHRARLSALNDKLWYGRGRIGIEWWEAVNESFTVLETYNCGYRLKDFTMLRDWCVLNKVVYKEWRKSRRH